MDKAPTGLQYVVFFSSGRSGTYEAINPLPDNWALSDIGFSWKVYKLDYSMESLAKQVASKVGAEISAKDYVLERKGCAHLNFALIEEIKES